MAAPWKQALVKSLEKNSSAPAYKYFQLATVRPDGRPANRSVAFRGFEDERIIFTTDTRSRKIEDISAQPWAEVCWYFSETREQFRLNGKLSLVDTAAAEPSEQQLVKDTWKGMSTWGRAWFLGPPPSAPQTGSADSSTPEVTDTPAPSFAVVRLDVSEVDHVDLVANTRQLFTLNGTTWKQQALNP